MINYEYLIEYCKKNNITLNKDYSEDKVTRETIIHANCIYENCLKNVEKNLRQFTKNGCYCNYHIKKLCVEKRKETCMEKYGVESALQSKEIRDKGKKTCLKKFGVEYASQSKDIKKQIKQTCMEKYGVEHSSQSQNVKEKFKQTCMEKYGVDTPFQSEEIQEKIKQTCMEKYGVENPFQSEEIKEKIKINCVKSYGVENVSQSQQIKEKKKKTLFKNYGVEYFSQSEELRKKGEQTLFNNYGVKHSLQSKEIRLKMEQTCLEKFGVENAMQNAIICEKSSKKSFSHKIYTFPSGKEIQVQGYEPFALDELIKTLSEDDIVTGCSNVPTIAYSDAEGKQHNHFPDIFIPSQNKCIEVKSTWTAEKKKDNIFLKQNAGKQFGYNYEIWVYNRKYEKINCYI
jgi:hypothetical protein